MKIKKDYFWPLMMLAGSTINVLASGIAISMGAHKLPDGGINPFFFMAMSASTIYVAANSSRIVQIYNTPANSQEEDVEMGRSIGIISRSSTPELPTLDDRSLEMVRTSYRDMVENRQNSLHR